MSQIIYSSENSDSRFEHGPFAVKDAEASESVARPFRQSPSSSTGMSQVVTLIPVLLTTIRHRGMTFRLREPVAVREEIVDGMWVLESERLHILAYGDTRQDALSSFQEDFADLWRYIAQAQDEQLAEDARQLKATLLALAEPPRGRR